MLWVVGERERESEWDVGGLGVRAIGRVGDCDCDVDRCQAVLLHPCLRYFALFAWDGST